MGKPNETNEKLEQPDKQGKLENHASRQKHIAQRELIAANLNLLANVLDNFTHGLTVGSAFLISKNCGYLSSISILLHEIPHEFSDFAILLKSGKTIFQCGMCQLMTSVTSFLGGITALVIGNRYQNVALSWLLPISAGGFIFVALSTMANV